MRPVAFLICLPMLGQQLHVDHVTVAGKDLQAMRRSLEALGLKDEYGGPHSNHATEMSLTSFPDGSYLELIAIQTKADPAAVAAHEWRKFLEENGGPSAWAVRPANLGAELDRLRTAGIMVSAARKNGRSRPDGVRLDWETAQVGPGNGNFFPFLIHDFTPRENRAYPGGKPTVSDITGIVKVVIAVKDLEASSAQFQKAYGLKSPERQEDRAFGAKLAWFHDTPVVLAAPLTSQSWLTDRLNRFGEAPCAFVLGKTASAHYKTKPGERWFGKQVSWFDSAALGWHLGLE